MRGSYVHYYLACLLAVSVLLLVNALPALPSAAHWARDTGLCPAAAYLVAVALGMAAWRRHRP